MNTFKVQKKILEIEMPDGNKYPVRYMSSFEFEKYTKEIADVRENGSVVDVANKLRSAIVDLGMPQEIADEIDIATLDDIVLMLSIYKKKD